MNIGTLNAARHTLAAAAMVLGLATGACADAGTTPGASAAAFVATGQVLDTNGRPLAGVQVTADDVIRYNANVEGVTDAQGRYRIRLPNEATSWRISASVTRTLNGERIRFDMHPDNPNPFPGADGGVRNFRWKLTGEHPEGGVYGSFVWFYGNPSRDFPFSDRDLEYTLEPVGPLVDGSAGAKITRMGVHTGSGWGLADVPFGRYRMSVRHVPTGRALRVRLRDTGAYTATVEGSFRSRMGGGTRPYIIEVEVTS